MCNVEPKFLVAQHNLASVPAILYWYDLPTMQAVAGLPATNGTDIPQQLDFVTQVHDDDKDGYNEDMRASSSTAARAAASWPVQPHATKVGDFKVSPAVHAGYAVTWYGLCAAGLYMTRILLTRGRG